jgi:ribose transport system permease protein
MGHSGITGGRVEHGRRETGTVVLGFFMREAGIGAALLLLCVLFAVFVPQFATRINVSNILTQISINTAISVGMTFVILLGGIDLSVGSVISFCSIAGGLILAKGSVIGTPSAIACAVAASIAAGLACGLFNGWVSVRWNIHPFIVTLGMLNIARGAALQISGSRTLFSFPAAFNQFGSQTVFGLPIIFIIAAALVAMGHIVLSRTVFGRLIYAIGNNEESVRLSGHNTRFYKVAAFVLCGAMVGIAAILYMLRLNIASPILGVGFELNAIAAVVIGGTSMSGGKGSMIGTFFGACIMGVLNNGLLLLGMGDFARQIVTGFVIVIAVILDTYRNKLSLALARKPDAE